MGHTHEDIDAAFSRIAEKLRQNEVETLPELLHIAPEVLEIRGGMYDISGWLTEYIVDIRKHTKPLHYRFLRMEHKLITMYRGQQDQPWKELDGSLFDKKRESHHCQKVSPAQV